MYLKILIGKKEYSYKKNRDMIKTYKCQRCKHKYLREKDKDKCCSEPVKAKRVLLTPEEKAISKKRAEDKWRATNIEKIRAKSRADYHKNKAK